MCTFAYTHVYIPYTPPLYTHPYTGGDDEPACVLPQPERRDSLAYYSVQRWRG